MEINRAALQQFRDVWAPLVEGIPAIIDASLRYEDLKRAVTLKEQEYAKLCAACEEQAQEGARRVAAVEEQVASARRKLDEAKASITAQANKSLEEANAAIVEANKRVEAARKRADDAEHESARVVGSHRATLDAMRAEQEAEQERLNAEIAALADRKTAIEQSIESLRQRILG